MCQPNERWIVLTNYRFFEEEILCRNYAPEPNADWRQVNKNMATMATVPIFPGKISGSDAAQTGIYRLAKLL